jgi:aryl-alcohol dehydrogenase
MKNMRIRAAVTPSAGAKFIMEDIELAEPKTGEILVKVEASGICHTDVEGINGQLPTAVPAVFGHEGAGTVVKVGAGVREFEEGDKVGFSFAYCNCCSNCFAGRFSSCVNFNKINFGGILPEGTSRLSKDGKNLSMFFGQSSFAEYAVVAAHTAIKVPYKDIDPAIIAPLGCGIQTGAGTVLNALKPGFGSSIAIFGCGTVGMSAIMAARIAGCEKIIAVGGKDHTLELAKELGATHTINRKTCPDIVAKIKEITNGGANYSIDTSGNVNFVRTGLNCLAPLGVEAIVGITPKMEIDMFGELMAEGKTIMGVIEGNSVPKLFIPQMVEYYRQGRFPVDRIMTFYDFDDIEQAYEDSTSGKCIKAVVRM